MFRNILLKLLILVLAFGSLAFWFGSQKSLGNRTTILVDENVNAISEDEPLLQEETVEDIVQKTSDDNITSLDVQTINDASVISKIENTPDTLDLKNAFSTKYNKDPGVVSVVLESKEGPYAKGSVDFDNSGYPAIFYAYNADNSWVIVAVENGVVACSSISGYSFPNSMIPQCYDQSLGDVVSR